MIADRISTAQMLRSAETSAWENEGGAPAPDMADKQFGRRVESDRSWTIYHVFSGVPAIIDGQSMTGLNKASATHGMLSLNLDTIAHLKLRMPRPSDPVFSPPKER